MKGGSPSFRFKGAASREVKERKKTSRLAAVVVQVMYLRL
jgi:hypothetical protein